MAAGDPSEAQRDTRKEAAEVHGHGKQDDAAESTLTSAASGLQRAHGDAGEGEVSTALPCPEALLLWCVWLIWLIRAVTADACQARDLPLATAVSPEAVVRQERARQEQLLTRQHSIEFQCFSLLASCRACAVSFPCRSGQVRENFVCGDIIFKFHTYHTWKPCFTHGGPQQVSKKQRATGFRTNCCLFRATAAHRGRSRGTEQHVH